MRVSPWFDVNPGGICGKFPYPEVGPPSVRTVSEGWARRACGPTNAVCRTRSASAIPVKNRGAPCGRRGSGLTHGDCEALALQLRASLLDLALQHFSHEERAQRDSLNVNQPRSRGPEDAIAQLRHEVVGFSSAGQGKKCPRELGDYHSGFQRLPCPQANARCVLRSARLQRVHQGRQQR